MQKLLRSYLYLFAALVLGILAGVTNFPYVMLIAKSISTVFMNFLQLLASPVVFLSILATLLGMQGMSELKILGRKVLSYTLLTTILATLIALTLFLVVDPCRDSSLLNLPIEHLPQEPPQESYFSFFLKIVPSNLVQAFLDNHVIGIAFVAIVLGLVGLRLPQENRLLLQRGFSTLFQWILKTTELLTLLMPLAIFAFTGLFVHDFKQGNLPFQGLSAYLAIIFGANIIQGCVILPILLKIKGISPLKTLRGSAKALTMALFSKSSNATLPLTLQCAEKNLGIHPRIASFSLPLCTVINMNGCAAFILTTVLFVAKLHGYVFSSCDLALWVGLSAIAAIGNAGVPMGCFFLSSAFLMGLGVPLHVMGLILPFYAFLDMVETALNVWSDLCVTSVIDAEVKTKPIDIPA